MNDTDFVINLVFTVPEENSLKSIEFYLLHIFTQLGYPITTQCRILTH